MKILTKDLIGAQLDWMVAKIEESYPGQFTSIVLRAGEVNYRPSTDWAQGGPIIEREGITLRCGLHGWDAELEEFDAISHGPTALIAAMRCYVASKLGDTVEIPEELL